MTKRELKDKIINLLSKDKVKEALELLINYLKDSEITNNLVVLIAELERLKKAYFGGIIPWDILNSNKNRIVMAILRVVDEIANDDIDEAAVIRLQGIIVPIIQEVKKPKIRKLLNLIGKILIAFFALILFVLFLRKQQPEPITDNENLTYSRVFEQDTSTQHRINYRIINPLLDSIDFNDDYTIVTSQLLEINQDSTENIRKGFLNVIGTAYQNNYNFKFHYIRSIDTMFFYQDSLTILQIGYNKTGNEITIRDSSSTLVYRLIE